MEQPKNVTHKIFFWKDKSGRGFTGSIELADMGESDNEEFSYDGDPLYDWAQEAEEGDEWENATDSYVCTSVIEPKTKDADALILGEILANVKKMHQLAFEVHTKWYSLTEAGDGVLTKDYPFESSFETIVENIAVWSHSIETQISNQTKQS